MRDVGREIGRHPIHADIVGLQIIEDPGEISQRDAKVRLLLPAAGVVALEPRGSEDFYRKPELQRFRAAGVAFSWNAS